MLPTADMTVSKADCLGMASEKPIRFDSTKVGFNVENAIFCLRLCILAYKPQSEVEKELPNLGYHGTDVVLL